MHRLSSILLFALVSALVGCGSVPSSEPVPTFVLPRVDYSGSWELDYSMTENAQDKLRFLLEVNRSQLEQNMKRRPDRNGMGAGQGMVDRAMADLQGVIRLGLLAEKISKSTVLEIEQEDDYVLVHRDGEYTLSCEYSPLEVSPPIGEEWCGVDAQGHLYFISRLPEGLTVTHRLILSGNGQRLNLATTVHSRQVSQPYSLNQVFMPFEPGASQYDCEYSLARKKTCWLGK